MWKRIDRACGRTARLLGEYLDGTLRRPQRRVIEAHLDRCAACRRELEAHRRTLALLADLPRRELSGDFDAALSTRLAGVQGRSGETAGSRVWFSTAADRYLRAPWPSPPRRLAPAGALAAAALALVAWRMQPVPPSPPIHPPASSAYVATLVREHQMLAAGSDLNATVVSHNVGGDLLGDAEEE